MPFFEGGLPPEKSLGDPQRGNTKKFALVLVYHHTSAQAAATIFRRLITFWSLTPPTPFQKGRIIFSHSSKNRPFLVECWFKISHLRLHNFLRKVGLKTKKNGFWRFWNFWKLWKSFSPRRSARRPPKRECKKFKLGSSLPPHEVWTLYDDSPQSSHSPNLSPPTPSKIDGQSPAT